MPAIVKPYLLVTNIPCGRYPSGHVAVDALWHKDLMEHLRYVTDLTLAAPLAAVGPDADPLPLPDGPGSGVVRVTAMPTPRSFARGVLSVPGQAIRLWKAVGRASVVHVGVAGWPLPLGWLAAPIARVRGKFLLVMVESAPWRTPPGVRPRRRDRLRAAVSERLARWCAGLADVCFFTQPDYMRKMLGPRTATGHVIPASWIDHRTLLHPTDARRVWEGKLHPPVLRLAFASRLTAAKGVATLLDAARLLDARRVPVSIDVYGSGELAGVCRAAAGSLSTVRIELRGTVPYHYDFFRALRPAHALLVPNLSDEQPRVVYDAASQAVPAIASDTAGLRACVGHDLTGVLVPPGDPAALASAIERLASDRAALMRMGLAALEHARPITHRRTHERRRDILLGALGLAPEIAAGHASGDAARP